MRRADSIDLAMVWGVFMRNVTEYSHAWKSNILPNLFEPVVYLLGMGLGLGYYLSGGVQGQDYLTFIAPGLCAAAAMNGASWETTYNMFVKLTYTKLYDAFLSTPAQIQDVAFGELLWAVTRASIFGLAFFAVMLVMTLAGYDLVSSPWALAMPLALALIGAAFALVGQLATTFIRQIELYAFYYTLWLTPLFLFSGIFFPVDRFPLGEAVAWCTPLYHAVRLCRGLCQGPLEIAHAVSAVWLVALCLVLVWAVPARLRCRIWR